MSCQHAEDVCQHCLGKVQTTTEKDSSPPEKALSLFNKKFLIFINSSVIAASGALWYFSTKKLFNAANKAFSSILETIVAPTWKKE